MLAEEAKARRESRKSGTSSSASGDVPAISEAATIGMAEPHTVGDPAKPFRVFLRAPVIAKGKSLYQKIQSAVPDVFLGAALSNLSGEGLDLDAVFKFWNARFEILRSADPAVELPESTRKTTEEELVAFTEAMFAYDLDEPPTGEESHVIDDYADAIWQLAEGFNEGLTREAIPRMLIESLRPEDFADLTRAIFKACMGCSQIYEGSLADRF